MDIDERLRIARESLSNTAAEITRLVEYIDSIEIDTIVDLLLGCRCKVLVSGVGTSAAAARKTAHSLSCLGVAASFLSPTDALHGASGSIKTGDILIVFSKGGQSREINELLPIAHRRGAISIATTEDATNPLGRTANHLLRVQVKQESDRAGYLATASTLAAIAAWDSICSVLMEDQGFSPDQFHLTHPGGDVGRKLAERES